MTATQPPGVPAERSNADIWRLIRQQAHRLATLRRNPTDRELDDFTRLVQRLPAPHVSPGAQ